MLLKRTDLAVEAKELWDESAQEKTKLSGVEASDKTDKGVQVSTVKILNEEGAAQLEKPVGTYITLDINSLIKRDEDAFLNTATVLSQELSQMLKMTNQDKVLVIGLGNSDITPDAVGPKALSHTMVTRHLKEKLPEDFSRFRSVAALRTGVTGTTGVESVELIKAVSNKVKPDCVIVIDALASRNMARVCRTVQLSDSGIVPGSGVGNSRSAINKETLGVKVIALGVPTVVDAATLAADIAEQAGVKEINQEKFGQYSGNMIVTPKEIDSFVNDISKLLGYGINLALHKDLTIEDVDMFLS